ncbi:DUF2630 family protein [Streptomyces sp. NPDC048737]|uniref:DUF2630 family protein n=1 Tax=unclassified Streptomyces TaxID=2593676 RepID=UPI0034329F00
MGVLLTRWFPEASFRESRPSAPPPRLPSLRSAFLRLREDLAAGRIDDAPEHQRIGELERALDQCWDLLRRRRAEAGFGENPDEARVRSSSRVEGCRG